MLRMRANQYDLYFDFNLLCWFVVVVCRLKTGWSVKTSSYGQRQQLEPINIEEQETIIEVIKRNEQLECMEQERVGKLMERLEKLRRNALGKTQKQCLLCGEHFGFLGTQKLTCNDCKQSVCHKCSIDGSIR